MAGIDIGKFFQVFKYGGVAKIVTIVTLGVIAMMFVGGIGNNANVTEASFSLATGFALFFLTAAGIALTQKATNTAVYVVFLGWVLLVGAATLYVHAINTHNEAWVLDPWKELIPPIIGTVSGMVMNALRGEMNTGGGRGEGE